MQPRKPEIEFYDTQSDPHEVNNQASNSKYAGILERMSQQLDNWTKQTHDRGGEPGHA
jgi:hypothetical protein